MPFFPFAAFWLFLILKSTTRDKIVSRANICISVQESFQTELGYLTVPEIPRKNSYFLNLDQSNVARQQVKILLLGTFHSSVTLKWREGEFPKDKAGFHKEELLGWQNMWH